MKISVQRVFVKQESNLSETFTGFEVENSYSINDESGNKLFYIYEQSSSLQRQFIAAARSMSMFVVTPAKAKVLTIERPFAWTYHTTYNVKKQGKLLGMVKRSWGFFKKVFLILDETQQPLFKVISKAFHPYTYRVYDNNKQEVAQILKKWSGLGKEMFTDADTFQIDFGSISDDKQKALILTTALAIDLAYFESHKQKKFKMGGLPFGRKKS